MENIVKTLRCVSMSCLWSFCLFVLLTGTAYSSFHGEELEQEPPKPILKSLKPDVQKKVTFEEGTPLESKPLSQKYVKKAAFLKKCQEKRNSKLSFEQLLATKVNLDIKNIELQEEIKGSLTLSQQKDLLALRMQSLIFQQKKLETFVSTQKKEPSLKEEKKPLKKKKSPKKTTSSGQGTSRTGSLYARCDDDSSGSSTEEMLSIPQEEEDLKTDIQIEANSKKSDLKRGASFLNLEGVSVLPNKRPRLGRGETQSFLGNDDQSLHCESEDRDISDHKKSVSIFNKQKMHPLVLELDEDSQGEDSSSLFENKLGGSSSFLVALPHDKKPFLMDEQYKEIQGVPRGGASFRTQSKIRSPQKTITRKPQTRAREESLPVEKSTRTPTIRQSSSFLVALPQDEKPFIIGGQYEPVRGLPSRNTNESLVEREECPQRETKALKKRQGDSLKNKKFPSRSASFRVTTPEGLNAFFNSTDQS